MGARQKTLEGVLVKAGVALVGRKIPRPLTDAVYEVGLEEIVNHVYRALGGQKKRARIAPGAWDIAADGMAIELDEERHFNRYRLESLRSSIYRRLSGFGVTLYRDYCRRYEAQCLRTAHYGGFWTNKRSEEEFGPAGRNGDLSGHGAPRWKQRAFYDFIKDLAPIALGVRAVRVSVWDVIAVGEEQHHVGEILDRIMRTPRETEIWSVPLIRLIEERASLGER